jgi:hypothetical protein
MLPLSCFERHDQANGNMEASFKYFADKMFQNGRICGKRKGDNNLPKNRRTKKSQNKLE